MEEAERVTYPSHADASHPIVDEVRLHDVRGVGPERLLDRDAVVADPGQDLADRFDCFGVRRYGDLEPADGFGIGA